MNGWVNNREAGDLICYRAHYDVTGEVMELLSIVYVGIITYPCSQAEVASDHFYQ